MKDLINNFLRRAGGQLHANDHAAIEALVEEIETAQAAPVKRTRAKTQEPAQEAE